MRSIYFNTLITHGGVFHADDVFATAFLFLARETDRSVCGYFSKAISDAVIRHIDNGEMHILHSLDEMSKTFGETTYDVVRLNKITPEENVFDSEDSQYIIYDIGGGLFDHHSADKEYRDEEKTRPYAAFGKVFREFYPLLLTNSEYHKFDGEFVSTLDATDNGGGSNMMSASIKAMNPDWTTSTNRASADKAFIDAVKVAIQILSGYFVQMSGKRQAYDFCKSQYLQNVDGNRMLEDKQVLILDKYAPYSEFMFAYGLKAVIYPSLRGGFNLSIPIHPITSEEPYLLREDLRGKKPDEIKEITGIETVTFIHPTGFLAAVDDLMDAIRLVDFVVEVPTEADPEEVLVG